MKKVEVFEGKSASEILSEDNENYTLLFELLDVDVLDQEFIWQIIRMVKPNENLLQQLTKINEEQKDWGKLIGTKPNYRLLYSLQLIEHFIPSSLFSSQENDQKLKWCKNFIICGGFSYLFSLLSKTSKGIPHSFYFNQLFRFILFNFFLIIYLIILLTLFFFFLN